jgi:Zn ribbon nucleic-acid-binding protein
MSNGRNGGEQTFPEEQICTALAQGTMPTDAKGLVGRRCPRRECGKYFKLKPGTGLKGDVPCHCPYCGFRGDSDNFWTHDQKEYVKAVAMNHASQELHKMLKRCEFDYKPSGGFGISVSMEVTGSPQRFHHRYRERELETDVVCDRCTLVYAIYGAFAFCPDCALHNSLTILRKNLEIAEKLLSLAATQEREVAEHLVGDALENIVSAFDGFGREICRVAAPRATSPSAAEDVRFQSLVGARRRLLKLFGFDLMLFVSNPDWDFACRCFQKRHLLAHKMGVIDEEYVQATKDPAAVVGRKVQIRPEEAKRLTDVISQLGEKLAAHLIPPPPATSPRS